MFSAAVTRLEIETTSGTWTDYTGSVVSIAISRNDADPGTMSAELANPALDPTVSTALRVGKAVRVRAQNGSGWTSVYTGLLDDISVDYRPNAPTTDKKAIVKITAIDAVTLLANRPEKRGVGTVDGLRWLMNGAGVPFVINGSSAVLSSGTLVANNDSASLWDQVLVTRDTALGYAWVDMENRLRVYDSASMNTATAATLTRANYREIDTNFIPDQIINTVLVNWRRYNIGTEQATDVPYGPYVDATSVTQWGTRSATYTIQGATEVAADIQAYAQKILTRNATAEVRARSISVPLLKVADLAYVRDVDLHSRVSVTFPDTTTSKSLRVVGISHEITPTKWIVTWAFSPVDAVSVALETPGTGQSAVARIASSDATTKADTARTTAISTASSDATTKASNAQSTAISTAATDATGKANTAQSNAISSAATDATTKANNAQSAAVSAAASDATTKANTAESNAKTAAAADAKTKADAAQAAAQSAAQSYADSNFGATKTTVTNWTVSGKTTIDGGKIETNSVKTNQLDALAITAKHTITGSLFQTSDTASRGIKINSGGLSAYDSAGAATLSIDAVSGAIAMKGSLTSGSAIVGATIQGSSLTTATSGTRVEIGTSASGQAVSLHTTDSSVPGRLFSASMTTDGITGQQTLLSAPQVSGGPTTPTLNLQIRNGVRTAEIIQADVVQIGAPVFRYAQAPWAMLSNRTAVNYGASADIPFSVISDGRLGWGRTAANRWHVLFAAWYRVTFTWKWNASATSKPGRVLVNGANRIYSPAIPAVAYGGATISAPLQLAVGDQVSAQVDVAMTTQPDGATVDNNFLLIEPLPY